MGTGKTFETKFKRWCNKHNVWSYKIPDMASSGTAIEAPADFIVVNKYLTIFYELKHTNNKISFPLSNFKKHQIPTLNKIKKHGGQVSILIEDGNNILYNIPPCVFESAQEKGLKSIKFDVLNQFKTTSYDLFG